MTTERERLADYQAALLSMLHSVETPEEAQDRMRQLQSKAGIASDACNVDLRMVDVAMQLTRNWGVIGDRSENCS